MKKSNAIEFTISLRQRAEKQLKINKSKNQIPLSETVKAKKFHELEVHQIELEMQQVELLLANEKAERAAEKYTLLYDFAPLGYFTLSKIQTITSLNHAAGQLLEKERGNLINKKIGLFIADETKIVFNEFIDIVYSSSIKQTTVVTFLQNNNTPISILLTGIAASDKKECYIIAIDITKRLEAEEKITMLSQAIEQSPASIIITDSKGIIEYVNKAFIKVSGYQAEEVMGKNPKIFKSSFTSLKEYKLLWETIKTGNTWEGELYNKKKSGELYWESVRISPIKNSKGENTHFLAVKMDITERKLIDVKMKKIIWHQSHEVRGPLTNIMGIIAAMNFKITFEEKLSLLNRLDESAKKLDAAIHAIVREATPIKL